MKKIVTLLVALLSSICMFADTVAKIGDAEYATLESALSSAVDGDEIVLVSDIDLSEKINIQVDSVKRVTLNLSGHTISSLTERVKFVYNEDDNTTTIASHEDSLVNLFGGMELTIKGGGILTNVSFTAMANKEEKLSSKINITNVTVKVSYFAAYNYESAINIYSDTVVTGSQFFIRSGGNEAGYVWKPELNVYGGVYEGTEFLVSPYSDDPCNDQMTIRKGTFTGCTFIARNGISRIELGNDQSGDDLKLNSCKFFSVLNYSNSDYNPTIELNAGEYNSCTGRVVVSVQRGIGVIRIKGGLHSACRFSDSRFNDQTYDYAIPKFEVNGGRFENGCYFNAKVENAIIEVNGGQFFDSRFNLNPSQASEDPEMVINDGYFHGVHFTSYEGSKSSQSEFNINGGTFDYCVILSKGATPVVFLNGGRLNGCSIGAVATMKYQHNPTVSNEVSAVEAYSCYIYSKNDELSGSGSQNPTSSIDLKDGDFYGCTTQQFKGAGKNVLITPTIVNACKIGDEGIVNAVQALSQLQTQDQLEFEVLHDCYTPATNNTDSSRVVFNNEPIAIGSGKTVSMVSHNESVVDSFFDVSGNLFLRGVRYTGEIEVQTGGRVYVSPGTRLKQDPVESGFRFLGSCQVDIDPSTGEYVVSECPGFRILVR